MNDVVKPKKKVYSIHLNVHDNGEIDYGCSAKIHPAEMITRLSAVINSLGLSIIKEAQKPKIDLIDPAKLPPNMKLRQ